MFIHKRGSGKVTDHVETVTVTEKTDQDGSDKRDLEVESFPFIPILLCFIKSQRFNNIPFHILQSNLHFYHFFVISLDQEIPDEDVELAGDGDEMQEIE